MARETAANMWPSGRALGVAVALLAGAGITTLAGNILIHVGFPDRPYPDDLLFRMVPPVYEAQYLTEPAIIGSLAILLVYAIRHARERFAEMLAMFGIFYLVRSVLMVLTPLANAYDGPSHYGTIPLDQLGMFPSGHAGAALMCFMLIDAARAPVARRVALWLMITQVVALLLSRGHFSIDLAGGVLLAYFVVREWNDGASFRPVQRMMGAGEPT